MQRQAVKVSTLAAQPTASGTMRFGRSWRPCSPTPASNYSIHLDPETNVLFAYLKGATIIAWTRCLPTR